MVVGSRDSAISAAPVVVATRPDTLPSPLSSSLYVIPSRCPSATVYEVFACGSVPAGPVSSEYDDDLDAERNIESHSNEDEENEGETEGLEVGNEGGNRRELCRGG